MNWTGGSLHRHSKATKIQKSRTLQRNFARRSVQTRRSQAEASLPLSQSFDPLCREAGTAPRTPGISTAGNIRIAQHLSSLAESQDSLAKSSQTRFENLTLEHVDATTKHLRDKTEDLQRVNNVERFKDKLLSSEDWLNLDTSRPLKMDFPARNRTRTGRKRKKSIPERSSGKHHTVLAEHHRSVASANLKHSPHAQQYHGDLSNTMASELYQPQYQSQPPPLPICSSLPSLQSSDRSMLLDFSEPHVQRFSNAIQTNYGDHSHFKRTHREKELEHHEDIMPDQSQSSCLPLTHCLHLGSFDAVKKVAEMSETNPNQPASHGHSSDATSNKVPETLSTKTPKVAPFPPPFEWSASSFSSSQCHGVLASEPRWIPDTTGKRQHFTLDEQAQLEHANIEVHFNKTANRGRSSGTSHAADNTDGNCNQGLVFSVRTTGQLRVIDSAINVPQDHPTNGCNGADVAYLNNGNDYGPVTKGKSEPEEIRDAGLEMPPIISTPLISSQSSHNEGYRGELVEKVENRPRSANHFNPKKLSADTLMLVNNNEEQKEQALHRHSVEHDERELPHVGCHRAAIRSFGQHRIQITKDSRPIPNMRKRKAKDTFTDFSTSPFFKFTPNGQGPTELFHQPENIKSWVNDPRGRQFSSSQAESCRGLHIQTKTAFPFVYTPITNTARNSNHSPTPMNSSALATTKDIKGYVKTDVQGNTSKIFRTDEKRSIEFSSPIASLGCSLEEGFRFRLPPVFPKTPVRLHFA